MLRQSGTPLVSGSPLLRRFLAVDNRKSLKRLADRGYRTVTARFYGSRPNPSVPLKKAVSNSHLRQPFLFRLCHNIHLIFG